MKRQGEKIVKSRVRWRQEKEVHKLRIIMTVVAVVLGISVAAGLFLAWQQWSAGQKAAQPKITRASEPVSGPAAELPVTDDSLNLLLVNSAHRLSGTYRPLLAEYQGVSVDSRILPALKKMMADASAAGCPLTLKSGYVDEAAQEALFQNEVKRLISEKKMSQVFAENKAQSTVGRGGYNENQTGLAVEFAAENAEEGQDFGQTDQYRWLTSHCVDYGFVLRYPADKETVTGFEADPAHFRYVGAANAVKMRAYAMCLEEYSDYLSTQSGT